MNPSENLILVPVYVKKGDEVARRQITERIEELSDVGRVIVVNQGELMNFAPETTNPFDPHDLWHIHPIHVQDPIGVWGAMNFARRTLESWPRDIFSQRGIRYIVFNTAPLYYGADDTRRLLDGVDSIRTDHAVGHREDIAGSLSSDPKIGRSRGYLEVFLSRLAESVCHHAPWLIIDGFCGLQALTIKRYNNLDWSWIGRQTSTPWGGELEIQLQAWSRLHRVVYIDVSHDTTRTWSSSFGTDAKVIVSMLDRARDLPVFDLVTKEHVDRAFAQLEKAPDYSWHQPWYDPTTAADEVHATLYYYNEHTTRDRWLEW